MQITATAVGRKSAPARCCSRQRGNDVTSRSERADRRSGEGVLTFDPKSMGGQSPAYAWGDSSFKYTRVQLIEDAVSSNDEQELQTGLQDTVQSGW